MPDIATKMLSSVQFDHWILTGTHPSSCTVMSHADRDHHPQYCAVYQPPIIVGKRFSHTVTGMKIEVQPDSYTKIKGIFFWLMDKARIRAQQPDMRIRTSFHSDWWYITDSKTAGILFIGNLDYPELPVVSSLSKYILTAAQRPLSAVMLPSYGGLKPLLHGLPENAEPHLLSDSVQRVAEELKTMRLKVAGLPHPINPSWSDFEFLSLPSRRV